MKAEDEAAYAILLSPVVTTSATCEVLGVWDIVNPNATNDRERVLKSAILGDIRQVFAIANQVFGPQSVEDKEKTRDEIRWKVEPHRIAIQGTSAERVLELCKTPQLAQV
jgi:hypothetical protein